ncbi:MAG: hypothetical protein NC311_19670 [Muribaculaceae bacterium]|nr:hypothetical protein [Muribaculaceae bacterium]
MQQTVRQPTCASCPNDLHFEEFVPKKQFGVMMHCGERFCTGGKRARRFKRSDPKIHVPSWCPKRKDPCELRVYTFSSEESRWMHHFLSDRINDPLYPAANHYALAHSMETALSPREFWDRCGQKACEKLLGAGVPMYAVVEIDDGLASVCFYRTPEGMKIAPFFDAARARKNRMEESD